MPFPANKTKIVCTLGPASESPEMLSALVAAGMDVAAIDMWSSRSGPNYFVYTAVTVVDVGSSSGSV